MTFPTNAQSTHAAIGNREDLVDAFYMLDVADTPFLSALERVEATSTKHEWLTSALAAAVSNNFNIEGDESSNDAAQAMVRRYNYTGISDKVPQVTRTQDKVKKAGRSKEMAFQVSVMMKALKRDVEKAALENQAAVSGSTTLARVPAGAQAWIRTNADKASDATLCTGDGTDIHTDGTARYLSEAMVTNALASAWSNGGSPTMGVCGKFQKGKIAAFSGASTRTSNGDTKKVTNSVDIYIDPLGNEIKFVPCRQAPTDVVYMFDMEHVALAVLDDFQINDLAKTGDSIRKQLVVEWTLEMRNEAASAAVYDLLAS